MKLKVFDLLDGFLLVGIPAIIGVAMLIATLTPGNSPIGLSIGWAVFAFWAWAGTKTLIKKYKKR